MQAGDLVIRRPIDPKWEEYNPWLKLHNDELLEIGLIIKVCEKLKPPQLKVLWSTGKIDLDWGEYLELVCESC